MIDLAAAVQTRLTEQVSALRSVHDALEFASLTDKGVLPQRLPAAFVVSLGWEAKADDVMGGSHVQDLTDTVSVIVVARHGGDRHGGAVRDALTQLRSAVVTALAGWTPDAATVRPLDFVSGKFAGAGGGAGFDHIVFRTHWDWEG